MTGTPAAQGGGRYSTVAIILHWLIAVGVLGLIGSGLWMTRAINDPDDTTKFLAFEVYQIHKSIGFTVLALTVLRLAWRLAHRPPPMPSGMPGWQRLLAKVSHAGFYILLIALPLSGWVMVTVTQFQVPTLWFGLLEIPHLPGLATDPGLEETAKTGHWVMGYLMIALLLLHVAGALKHHFQDRDDTLWRMLPLWRRQTSAKES